MARHPQRFARAGRATLGFTLLEVLLAALIAGMALAAVSWTMTSAAQAKAVLAEDPQAYLLAREIRELAEFLPREPSGSLAATGGAGVLALDSLHGAVFSPPLRSDRTTEASLAGWAQRVTLTVCSLDDPAGATGESATLGVARKAERLYRLAVEVSFAGEPVDRFEWWLTP
ncbi:MAG TPA: type II secretion system protein [Planctomycetota bacterium]|nr:type II secretion system protein [Planctomycetota bacterium]